MTFDDTPPLKNGNNDMRRSQEGRHTIKQVRLQELQGPTSANCQSLSLVLMRSWSTSTNSLSKAYADAGRNMLTNMRPQPHWHPSQALCMIWCLHQVPLPQKPPYGKIKTSFVTIAKAKTMIHGNAPISCAHYAMAKVT